MKTSLFSCAGVALALAVCCAAGVAQTQPPAAPVPEGTTAAPAGPKFPAVEASNFTAATPSRAEVEAFLKTSWGYDPNREWEVWAIEKTKAPGVSKVTVLLGEKPNPQVGSIAFFVTPDGKHLIAQNDVLDFGPDPYAENYRILQQRADGPSQGAPGKQFLLVEFADFQCPHCKEAQPLAKKLIADFPQAHYVFEMFPLVTIHPMAFKAAAFGACVYQEGGTAGFFKYADGIFEAQQELDGQGADQALRNAVTAAGLDPDKTAACADSPAGKAAVDASMQLGQDLNVNETPTLFVDGRALPMMGIPYEELKKIIEYQFNMDKEKAAQ